LKASDREAALTGNYVPPNDVDMEQAVLCGCLMRPTVIDDVIAIVKPNDFYRESHQKIWSVVCSLSEQRKTIDRMLVLQELRARQWPDVREYAANMFKAVVGGNPVAHAGAIAHMAVQRRMIDAAMEVITTARIGKGSTVDLINDCQREIMQVTSTGDVERLRESFEAVGTRVWEEAERRADGVTGPMGLTMGFPAFDDCTMGFQPGDLVALVGRSNQGKTAFALHVADHNAVNQQKNVLIFEREMISDKLYTRMLCSRAKVKAKEFHQWLWSTSAYANAKAAAAKLYTGRVQVVDMRKGPLTPAMIRRECRSMKREQGLDLVVVDYLELMKPDVHIPNERERLDDCVRELKDIAGEFECVVMVLCQVGRAVEGRENVRPRLSDIRGSGGIEAALDFGFSIYNENWYARQQSPAKFADDPERLKPDEVEINTLKSRSDASPFFKVGFIPGYTHFYDISHAHDNGTAF